MTEIAPVPLSELTTLGTGAMPERMVVAESRDELVQELRRTWAAGGPWLVLGGGSNLFAGDEPFAGTVIRVQTSGITPVDAGEPGIVHWRIEAGHGWDGLVESSVAAGLAGIEAMSGIPGTVGAAPIQNVGAYGQEIVQTLVEVELLDAETHDVVTVPAAELGLGFRTSVLKRHYGEVPEREGVILSVTLGLRDVGAVPQRIVNAQLRSALGLGVDDLVTLQEIRQRVLATRAAKGMVLDPADVDTASAGSFFQNPIVSADIAALLPADCPRWPIERADRDAALVIPLEAYTGLSPRAPQEQLHMKLSAAWLIEHAGIARGFALPRSRAGLSTKHALALTNRGGASAEELAELARYVRYRVQSEFGILLMPEPVVLGVDL